MKQTNPSRYSIAVRQYLPGQTENGSPRFAKWNGDAGRFHLVETVTRALRAEQIGNFSPLFCTYGGNSRCLVKSDAGDLSDPFRRGENYAQSLFITLPQMSPAEERQLRGMGLHPEQTGMRNK